MAVETPTVLKTYFQTGDKPTQGQFVNLIDSAIPALVYRALISQTGVAAPTAVILQNTLGEVPTFNYDGVGDYSLSIVASLFIAGKTFVMVNSVVEFSDVASAGFLKARRGGNTSIELKTFSFGLAGGGAAGAPTVIDQILSNVELEILVYP